MTALYIIIYLLYFLFRTIIAETTGVLVIENAMSLFHTQYLARGNYSAELTEISHGTLLGDSAWDSRGVFGILVWGPKYGVPLGSRGGAKNFENFFSRFFHVFQREMVQEALNCSYV